MSYVIAMPDGTYVLKDGGWNHFVEDPRGFKFPQQRRSLERKARPSS